MVAGCSILVFLPNGKIHRQYGLDLYFNLHLPNRARRIVHGRRHQDEEIRKLVKQGRLNAVLFIVLSFWQVWFGQRLQYHLRYGKYKPTVCCGKPSDGLADDNYECQASGSDGINTQKWTAIPLLPSSYQCTCLPPNATSQKVRKVPVRLGRTRRNGAF